VEGSVVWGRWCEGEVVCGGGGVRGGSVWGRWCEGEVLSIPLSSGTG